jgi:carbamoyltransferase
MNILGINGAFHESAAALIRSDETYYAAEEERFTGVRHAKKASPYGSWILPFHAINWCLKEVDITLDEVDHIAYSFEPQILKESIKRGERFSKEWFFQYFNKNIPGFLRNEAPLNLEMQKRFVTLESSPSWEFHFVEHHLAHAASAFLVSPFDKAAILSVDGIGEKTCTLMAIGDDTEIKKIKEIQYPNSLGYFYEEVTKYLGFQRNNDEYKVMALAAYGKPKYYDLMRKLVDLKPQGEYTIKIDFKRHSILGIKELCDLLGVTRHWESEIQERHMDIAASVQKILEDTVLHMLDWLYNETKLPNLCLAGGVALNCVMNERIRRDSPFKNIFVQPAANDAGTALGASLLVYHSILKRPKKFVMQDVYIGPAYSDEEIQMKLNSAKLSYRRSKDIARDCARLISEGNIVGWFQGRMEFGPRALGNRSILADPRNAEFRDVINKIKGRENFRPLAPSVLEEKAGDYFEDCFCSPFMQFTRKVKSSRKGEIPAVVHTDGTARVQTVNKSQNLLFYRLLEDFFQITGIPMVINTSLNYQGKSIVCTIEQAIDCFFNCGIDYMALGSYLLSKGA